MAVTKIRKISSTIFLVAILISLVVIALFVFGGEVSPENKLSAVDADMWQPAFAELMLYWGYILLAVTAVSWLLFTVFGFFKNLKESPKAAIGGLGFLIALVALFGITYMLGSGELLNIPGYDGSDNNPNTLRMTDMWIFSMYIMLGLSILAILVSPVLGRRK